MTVWTEFVPRNCTSRINLHEFKVFHVDGPFLDFSVADLSAIKHDQSVGVSLEVSPCLIAIWFSSHLLICRKCNVLDLIPTIWHRIVFQVPVISKVIRPNRRLRQCAAWSVDWTIATIISSSFDSTNSTLCIYFCTWNCARERFLPARWLMGLDKQLCCVECHLSPSWDDGITGQMDRDIMKMCAVGMFSVAKISNCYDSICRLKLLDLNYSKTSI